MSSKSSLSLSKIDLNVSGSTPSVAVTTRHEIGTIRKAKKPHAVKATNSTILRSKYNARSYGFEVNEDKSSGTLAVGPVKEKVVKTKVVKKAKKAKETPTKSENATPDKPKGTAHMCPVCWVDPPLEPTATKCGHIFCNACILKTLGNTRYCPMCQKTVVRSELIRIYLNNN